MALPYFHTEDTAVNMLQTSWKQELDSVLSNPLLRGQILRNVALANGTTQVNHKLQRIPLGWFLIAPKAAVTVYQSATQTTPTLTLALVSNGAVTVDVYVF